MDKSLELRNKIIDAGYRAVEELISVAEDEILRPTPKKQKKGAGEDDTFSDIEMETLAADRLKSAAQTKKIAIFDAFDILERVDSEKERINNVDGGSGTTGSKGFAERRSK